MAPKKDKRRMHITVKQAALQRVLTRCLGATNAKSTLPLLGCFLLETECSDLWVSATDLDITIRTSCSTVDVVSFGKIAVPASRLADIVKALPSGDIELEVMDGFHMAVRHGDSRFNLACLDPEEYPALPDRDAASIQLTLDSDDISGFINACSHALSSDQQKPHMCCLHLQGKRQDEDEIITAAATDGHRIAVAGKRVDVDDTPFPAGITIPRKALDELKKFDGPIEVGMAKNVMCFLQGETVIFAQLLEREFPNYRRVIPLDLPNIAVIEDAAEFAEMVRRVNILSDRNRVDLDLGEDDIEIRSSGVTGDAVDLMPAVISGDIDEGPVTIRFNARQLVDAVSSLGSGEMFIKYKDGESPVMFLPGDHSAWDERLNLVVPLRG